MRCFPARWGRGSYNYQDVASFLADIDWDCRSRRGAGTGQVTTKQAFMSVAGNNRLPLVREGCASGKYNAIVLLGGGDPATSSRSPMGRQYRIPVASSLRTP